MYELVVSVFFAVTPAGMQPIETNILVTSEFQTETACLAAADMVHDMYVQMPNAVIQKACAQR